MFDRNLDPTEPLNDLEQRLRSWGPSSGGLDRDRMLFEAGRASARVPIGAGKSTRTWKLATAAAALVAVGLGQGWRAERSQRQALQLTLAARTTSPEDRDPAAPSPTPTPDPLVTGVDPSSYLALARGAQPPLHEPLPGPSRDGGPARLVDPQGSSSRPPLRPHDLDRVLSL